MKKSEHRNEVHCFALHFTSSPKGLRMFIYPATVVCRLHKYAAKVIISGRDQVVWERGTHIS